MAWTKKEINYLHLIWGLGLLLSFLVVDWQTAPVQDSDTVLISGQFREANLNTKVLFSNTFAGHAPFNQPLEQYIRQTFRANDQPDKIVLGRSYEHNQAWIFFKLVNTTGRTRKLVIQADHVRLDAMTLYRLENEKLIAAGYLSRAVPIAHRPYTFRAFALPVWVPARDTACFLLQTRRYTGLQEPGLCQYHAGSSARTCPSRTEHSRL